MDNGRILRHQRRRLEKLRWLLDFSNGRGEAGSFETEAPMIGRESCRRELFAREVDKRFESGPSAGG